MDLYAELGCYLLPQNEIPLLYCLTNAPDAHVTPTQSCHDVTILPESGLFKLHLHATLGCCVLQPS